MTLHLTPWCVAWLRRMIFADGKVDDEERKFLHELKGEASQVSHEFEALFNECMKEPQKQRTVEDRQVGPLSWASTASEGSKEA